MQASKDVVTVSGIGVDSSSFGVSATMTCPPAVAGMVVVAWRGLVLTDVVKPVSECFVSVSMDKHVSFWLSDAKDVSCESVFERKEISRGIVDGREGWGDK